MVVISEGLVKRLIQDVVPKVEKLTGWDTNFDDLSLKLIRRDQVWEYGLKATYDALGVDTEPKSKGANVVLNFAKTLMSYMLFGQYEPLTETLFIIPDNFRSGTNESGLALTLGHELVHRCQYINNPIFSEIYSTLTKNFVGSNVFDRNEYPNEIFKKYLQAYMTLVEGDAYHVETQLKNRFYQNAKTKGSYISNIVGTALLLFSFTNGKSFIIEKLRQYGQGKEILDRVYETEGRSGINRLYDLDAIDLYDKFG